MLIDKKNFKCYKFENENSYYYGEVVYLDEMNNIIDEVMYTEENKQRTHTEENNPNLRLIRHGIGVMMYN